MDKQQVYCRDKLGGALDIKRVEHVLYGHAPHDFTAKFWWFGKEKLYHCPGVERMHHWKAIGTVFDPDRGIMIVESCTCGEERARPLDKSIT
jgi:hypothetical protein